MPDLYKNPHLTLYNANEHLLWVIKKIMPELIDVKIWYDEKTRMVIDIDYLFKGQECKLKSGDEWDGIQEYIPGSKTYKEMLLVADVLIKCFDLKQKGD